MQDNNTEYECQTEKISMTDADSMNDEKVSHKESNENVILERSICKCSTTSFKPAKNTSINASQIVIREKTASDLAYWLRRDYIDYKDDLRSLSKNDPLFKKFMLMPITVQEGLLEIIRKYDPNYFLTFQLPSKRRTYDYLKFEPKLKMVMRSFQWNLEGRHWNHHPVPFICFLEKGISGYWHAHILFKSDKDIYTISDALNKARTAGGRKNKNKKKIRLPRYSFNIQEITKHSTEVNTAYDLTKYYYKKRKTNKRQKNFKKAKLPCNHGIELYCIKELYPDCNGHFDSDRMVLGENLLPIIKKTT